MFIALGCELSGIIAESSAFTCEEVVITVQSVEAKVVVPSGFGLSCWNYMVSKMSVVPRLFRAIDVPSEKSSREGNLSAIMLQWLQVCG